MVDKLLANEADVTQANTAGSNPFYFAALEGNVSIANALLKKRKDAMKTRADGISPLHCAAQENRLDMARMLIVNGVKIDQVSTEKNLTALYFAVQNNHLAMVDLLLTNGADANIRPFTRLSPFEKALANKNIAIAKRLLLDSKIDVNIDMLLTDSTNYESVLKELSESIFEDILKIQDRNEREIALLNAAGKGERGKDHPAYKAIDLSTTQGIFSTSNPTFDKINQVLADPAQAQVLSSTSVALHTFAQRGESVATDELAIDAWNDQFTLDDVKEYLVDGTRNLKYLLDRKDKNGQTFRHFLIGIAKDSHPLIICAMLKMNLVRDKDEPLLNGMQRILWKWMQEKLSYSERNKIIAKIHNPKSSLHKFMAKDPDVLREIQSSLLVQDFEEVEPHPPVTLPPMQSTMVSAPAVVTIPAQQAKVSSQVNVPEVVTEPHPPLDEPPVAYPEVPNVDLSPKPLGLEDAPSAPDGLPSYSSVGSATLYAQGGKRSGQESVQDKRVKLSN